MKARDEAFAVVERDPELLDPDHAVIRRTYGRKYEDKVLLIDVG
jgi:hypothetical protein